MRMIYNFLLYLLSPLILLILCLPKKGKPRVGKKWLQYIGFYSSNYDECFNDTIWFHASSVGEVIASKTILKKLKEKYPNKKIIITTMTPTGEKQVKQLIGNDSMFVHAYLPIDLPGSINRFINKFNPCKVIIMEMELWPNLLYITKKRKIKSVIINARLSDKSYFKYQKYKSIRDLIFPHIYKVLAQYENDVINFNKLGVNSIVMTGSIKFDIEIPSELINKGDKLSKSIGEDRFIWSAVSTHEGEEEIILKAHQKLLLKNPKACLILVPRHPERFSSVENLCYKYNLTVVNHTHWNQKDNFNVYIGNTMGELPLYIQASDICFMGGSLLGDKIGGHNLLEPAYLRKLILTGPSYYNFKSIAETFINESCCIICKDYNDIYTFLLEYKKDNHPDLELKMANIINKNTGSVEKTMMNLD